MAYRSREAATAHTGIDRSRRSRGFGGCTACRQKRMKCDERRPQCSICVSNGLLCAYEKNLFFDLDGQTGSESGRFRRPILTEDERLLMSQTLTASIGPESALDLVFAIDSECEAIATTQDLQIHRGPFGAFRSSRAVAGPDSYRVGSSHAPTDPSGDEALDFDAFSVDQIASPNTVALASTFFGDPDPAGTYDSNQDFWNFFGDASRVQEVFDDLTIPQMPQYSFELSGPNARGASPSVGQDLCRVPSPYLATSSISPNDALVPKDAVHLLKHYQSTVLRSLTPFRHSKTPWHVLFLPQAKNCLAALTLGEIVDSATLCSFFGTLAISAFSLSGVSFSSKWQETARVYKRLARHHIKVTLETAYDVPKKAKYKAILIALLTMVQLSVISGNSDHTETYFLEAEKFIRLRGLNKKKSRKVRLLHHCYAFERILYESTLKIGSGASHRSNVHKAIEASGTAAIGQDALSFRLSHWKDLEHDMRRIKGQHEGENDLHLQNPGSWPSTLYPEIFGVPEQILMMISLILRLAREKDSDDRGVGLRLGDFLERAKAIEKLIQRLERPSSGSDVDNLREAMHLALSIYFYRRIYDVDPSILQDKVLGVLNCLTQSHAIQNTDAFGAARYNWPAFIAAREAQGMEAQSLFSTWLKNAAQQTGLNLFTSTLQKAERAWEVRSGNALMPSVMMDMG